MAGDRPAGTHPAITGARRGGTGFALLLLAAAAANAADPANAANAADLAVAPGTPRGDATGAEREAVRLDSARSRFVFELRTRWGQPIEGVFPRNEGEVRVLPDGSRQVRVRLDARDLVVEGSDRFTRFARGERFLDAARYPWLEFRSEPYSPGLLVSGGPLPGTLTLRGVSRPEVFRLEPGACAQPARDCDVVAHGAVNRADYGLQTWRWALRDDVRFHLRVRLEEVKP